MKLVRRLPFLALALAGLTFATALRAEDFVINDGTSDVEDTGAGKVVLVNQTGQPKIKVFVSAKPKEKPQPQVELKESNYTVSLAAPITEISIYVTTMDNKKKSSIRKAKPGDFLAVVFEDGRLAVLKIRTPSK